MELQDKNRVREKFLEERKKLSNEDLRAKSREIQARILELVEAGDIVFCYVSFRNEVRTRELLEELLERSVKVTVPVTRESMEAAEIHGLDELEETEKGIMEPESPEIVSRNDLDLAIVPGVAFDRNGNRIGYGKGYYDRFLTGFQGWKIGIIYHRFLEDRILTDSWDVPVDKVVTETETVEIP